MSRYSILSFSIQLELCIQALDVNQGIHRLWNPRGYFSNKTPSGVVKRRRYNTRHLSSFKHQINFSRRQELSPSHQVLSHVSKASSLSERRQVFYSSGTINVDLLAGNPLKSFRDSDVWPFEQIKYVLALWAKLECPVRISHMGDISYTHVLRETIYKWE